MVLFDLASVSAPDLSGSTQLLKMTRHSFVLSPGMLPQKGQ